MTELGIETATFWQVGQILKRERQNQLVIAF
jgi:hypothetical protein